MRVFRPGDAPSSRAPADSFSGVVRRDPMVSGDAPGRTSVGTVTFEPGARTAWHTHPAGQILIVTAGRGWVRCEGEPKHEVFPGDSVWFPAGVRHWHGATATTAMTHVAVTEAVDGSAVEWMEHVNDADYIAD